MNFINHFILILLFVIFASCSKEKINESVIKEKSLDGQVLEAYSEGLDSLKGGDVLFAAKKFNEAEMLFPQSEWAPKSALMAAYSYYSQDYLDDAIAELDRFLLVYPLSKDKDYAIYLLANSHYEKIVDEKKDLQSILFAKENFVKLQKNFPNTEYALDSEFKIDLINDILASKEMYLGRYYFDRKKWIPSINRFRTVIDEYDTTIYVEEALHRLVEVYYTIGLINEAEKYANILGYNYRSSKWYETSYAVFNRDYKSIKAKKSKEKKSFMNKVKSLFAINE
jgi:outer membrane protein assembly factor BamD